LQFEHVYGPGGSWAALFREVPGYLGTDLLRAVDGSGRYLTLDRWQSQPAYEEFRASRRGAYDALDRACEGLTQSEERLGDYLVLDARPEDGGSEGQKGSGVESKSAARPMK
jgi:hypothetical protein